MVERSVERPFVLIMFMLSVATACQAQMPAATPLPLPSLLPPAATATMPIQPTSTSAATSVVKGVLTCPPPAPLPANTPLAARVNNREISLDQYNRQLAQAENAFALQGSDPSSAEGQEALKSLRQQVLEQMINTIVVELEAEKQGVKVSDADLNARLAQMVQDAGSVDKVTEYLAKVHSTLSDFCAQNRSIMLGEKMFDKTTSSLPTRVEQVHVRQILVSTPALAQSLRDRARKGEDFASLARQYSMDETSKSNGGDMGWLPRGVQEPELDAVIFQLSLNQISDVIATEYGYHIVQVLAKDTARELLPEHVQKQRESVFLASLQNWRNGMKIERLVH